jgi:hypothetical protein
LQAKQAADKLCQWGLFWPDSGSSSQVKHLKKTLITLGTESTQEEPATGRWLKYFLRKRLLLRINPRKTH